MPFTYTAAAHTVYDSLQNRLDNDLERDTKSQYRSGVKKFMKFLQEMCPDLQLPLSELDWCLFIQWMRDNEKLAPGTAKQYVTTVGYFLECSGYPMPQWKHMKLLKRIKRQPKGLITAKSCRKQPIHWKLVQRIADIADHTRMDMSVFLTILFTGVAGFFRLGELLPANKQKVKQDRLLRVGHVQFYPSREEPDFMSIYLPYSKIDKFGLGVTIVIPSNPDDRYCPVQKMLALTTDREITEPLFLWPNGTIVTKAAFIRMLRDHLKALGIDWKQYSGHSLRRGAAVSAKASGASDELIKLLGRWSSDAYKIYLRSVPAHIQQLNTVLAAMRKAQPA